MLLRFGVRNHLSIRKRQELSLVASSLKDIETGLLRCSALAGRQVLPAAVIYGANASGKSNIVAALSFMRAAVLHSHSGGEPEGGVPRIPFALDRSCAEAVSSFDADFVVEGVRYHYGFEASDGAFESEWLYAYPSGRRQTLFERTGAEFLFGRNLKGRNKIISELTRSNSLFVSAATQNDHEELSKISGFFRSLRTDSVISIPGELASTQLAERDIDNRVIEFLRRIGTGVTDYRMQETDLPEVVQIVQREIAAAVKKYIKEPVEFRTVDDGKHVSVELAHKGRDDEKVFFELERESAGTRRLLILLGRIFRVLDEGAQLVVDELDASLHTQACEAVVALFSSHQTNPRGAQLIATTHDTNLLRSPLLRRDQVWFTEKDTEGATFLYPLTDIRTRKDDNIERGYLQGRYGAIPFSGSVSDLITAE